MKPLRNILPNVLTSLLLASALAPVSVRAQNLAANPGFEDDATTFIEWKASAVANGATAEIDNKEFHGGKQSLRLDQASKLTLPSGAKEAESLAKFLMDSKAGGSVLVSQVIPVEEGKSYDFSFWYKAEGLVRENTSDQKQGYAHLQVWIFWLQAQEKSVEGENATKYRWVMNEGVDAPDWVEAVNKGYAFSGRLSGKSCVAPPGARFANIRFVLPPTLQKQLPKCGLMTSSFRKPASSGYLEI